MQFTLGTEGLTLADHEVEAVVLTHLEQQKDLAVTNELALLVLRSLLLQMPVEERPQITWFIYGKEVHFDKHMRSKDAWSHWSSVWDTHIEALVGL